MRHAKTEAIAAVVHEVLEKDHPMTVRQVYYQLVSRQVIENTRSKYQAVSSLLVDMRKDGEVPWDWIEDRIRKARRVSMWDDLKDFGENVVDAYRRNVWSGQDTLVEVWLEKDALSGIFQDVVEPYGVTLNVGRGYDGWSSLHEAFSRYAAGGKPVNVLYFGDWDPSGEDMFRSLEERIGFFYFGEGEDIFNLAFSALPESETCPEFTRCALLQEDIKKYELPPDFAKKTDTRRDSFVERYGDEAVELDALPPDVLRERIKNEVEARIDLEAIEASRERSEKERQTLKKIFKKLN
jgi:hypothetical protein